MIKKLFTASALLMSASCMLTSCLEGNEDDNETLGQAYFTADGNVTQVVLHQDGGGTVIPLMSSIKSPTDFLKNERYILQFKYRKGDISADGKTVTGAELIAGEVIDVHNPLTTGFAAEAKITDPDSLFAVSSFTHVWAYRGYLTTVAKAFYSVKDGKGIFPTFNLTYNPTEDITPNRIKFNLCYNRHSGKDASVNYSTYEFATSFRLGQLSSLVPGNDSIEVTIQANGIDKPYVLKVGRNDLSKGNY